MRAKHAPASDMLFSRRGGKTWDRSFETFAKLVKEEKV
jgi:hypothetical protein